MRDQAFDGDAGGGRAGGPAGDAAPALAARPPAVHFAGLEPGRVHRRTVRLVNASACAALRAHVVPPRTPFFKVTHRRGGGGGALLPGLADVLVVEFCPTEARHYADAVRVHSNVSAVAIGRGE